VKKKKEKENIFNQKTKTLMEILDCLLVYFSDYYVIMYEASFLSIFSFLEVQAKKLIT
jgi:hypothetical protein